MLGYILGIVVGQVWLWFVYHEPMRNMFALFLTVVIIAIWEGLKALFIPE